MLAEINIQELPAHAEKNPTQKVRLLLEKGDTDKALYELSSKEEALVLVEELVARGTTLTHEGAQTFFRSKGLRHVRALTLDGCPISLGVIEAFYHDCVFDSLTSLTIIETSLDEDAWERWIFYPWWKNLRVLYISCRDMSDMYAEALTWDNGLAAIEHVTLHSPVLTDRITNTLATATLSPTLKTFSVESPLITAKGWSNLLQNKGLTKEARELFTTRSKQITKAKNKFAQLNTLLAGEVGGESWRDALVEYLSDVFQRSPTSYAKTWLPYLKAQPVAWPDPFEVEAVRPHFLEKVHRLLPFLWLSVRALEPKFGGMEWGALAESPAFSKVRSISSQQQPMPLEEATQFALSRNIANLREIEIGLGELDDEAAITLFSSPNLTSLSAVLLSFNQLTVCFVRWLCEAPLFSRLEKLDLSYNKLSDDSMTLLCQHPAPLLKSLSLPNNDLTDLSLQELVASPLFQSLEEIVLERNKLSEDGLNALVNAAMNAPKLKRLIIDSDFVAKSSHAKQLKEKGVSFRYWYQPPD